MPEPVSGDFNDAGPRSVARSRRILMIYPEPPRQWGGERLRKLALGLRDHGWESTLVAAPASSYRRRMAGRSLEEWEDSLGRVVRAFDFSIAALGWWSRSRRRGTGDDSATGLLREAGGWSDALARRAARLLLRKVVATLSLLWYPDWYAGWIPFATLKALLVARREHPDALLSSSPPGSSHLAALALHQMTGIPWVADFRDPWARAAEHGYPVKPSGPVRRKLESLVCSRATAVTAVSPALAEELSRDHHVKAEYLPHGFDRLAEPRESMPPHDDRLWLLHAGTLARWSRDLAPLLGALDRCASAGVPVGMRQVGDVDTDDPGLEEAIERGLVVTDGVLPQSEARRMIREAAVALLMVSKPGRLWVTTKLWDYLAEGAPILLLADPDSQCARILDECGAGWVVPFWDEQAIYDKLVELHGKWAAGDLGVHLDRRKLGVYQSSEIARRLVSILDRSASTDGHG